MENWLEDLFDSINPNYRYSARKITDHVKKRISTLNDKLSREQLVERGLGIPRNAQETQRQRAHMFDMATALEAGPGRIAGNAAKKAAAAVERRSLISENAEVRKRFDEVAGDIRNMTGERRRDLIDGIRTDIATKKGHQFREVNPTQFHTSLSDFASQRPDEAGFITWRTPEEMSGEGMRTFLSADGKSGYAIHPESGDIRNVFNHGAKGAGARAVAEALSNGGKVLDAFDTNLGNFYRDFGFKETSRFKWDDAYRPANWNDGKYGKPDVIAMQHPKAGQLSPDELMENYNKRRSDRKITTEQKSKPPARRLTPKMVYNKDSRKDVQSRVANAVRLLDAPLPSADEYAPPLRFLDQSKIVLDNGPTAGPLPERAPFGPKQARGHMQGLHSDENMDLIRRQIGRGERMVNPHTGNPVMREFYPSYKAVDDVIGNEGGNPEVFRKALSAAAIRNGVPAEIVNGSLMHWGMNDGGVYSMDELMQMSDLPPSERKEAFFNLAERIRTAGAKAAPDAQGFQLLPVHPQSFAGLLKDEFDAYKIPWYDRQKAADIPGNVLDTHEATGGTLASPFHRLFAEQGGFSSAGEYGAHEAALSPLFRELGLSSREGQALRWGGGGGITGLRTPPTANYAQLFEDAVMRNSQHRNIDPMRLIGDVAKGMTFLYNPR